MVHKKYIKRNGKVFGPYLYQNYRENGVTKTRYLGKAKTGKRKNSNKLLIGFGFLILFILIFGYVGLFFEEKGQFLESEEFKDGFATYSPFNILKNLFIASNPINIFVQIIKDGAPEWASYSRPPKIFVCEGEGVDEDLFAKDKNGGLLTFSFWENLGIALFFDPPEFDSSEDIWFKTNLYSRDLNWEDINLRRDENNAWAIYPETISVSDDSSPPLTDFFKTDLVIIEVNNLPEFEIGANTMDLHVIGEDSNFYYDLGSHLINNGEETGLGEEGLVFNISFLVGEHIFNISDSGVINVTGNDSFILPEENSTNYRINVTVTDTGLSMRDEIHEKMGEECYNLGYTQESRSRSEVFDLTVTRENRVPIITSYFPNESNFIILGTKILYFNLTAYDADWTPLNVEWFVGNDSKESFVGLMPENVSEFEYLFGCNVFGDYIIRAVVDDGLANDSIEWNVSVDFEACPQPSPSRGGGGGGSGRVYCEEKWGCGEWNQCTNLKNLSETGWASKETELLIKERCSFFNYTEEICGFQQRICKDYKFCNSEFKKPPTIRECYYTDNPTCEDGIKNCHDRSCEVSVDCGGPCEACPTCFDGIKNQNEEKVDCGGVCEECPEVPLTPIIFKSIITYSWIILLILILGLIINQIVKYVRAKNVTKTNYIQSRFIKIGKKVQKNVPETKIISSLFLIGGVIILLFFANFYITGIGQTNTVVSSISEGGGFLASYGFINSLFDNFGLFFVSQVFVSIDERAELVLSDDSDGGIRRFSGSNFFFYADYVYNNQISASGFCQISFDNGDTWESMDLVGDRFEIMKIFDYKGTYDFLVQCSESNLFPADDTLVSGNEEFIITNSPPDFMPEAVEETYLGIEDTPLIHDFFNNFTDLDTNDEWTFLINEINGERGYDWINLSSEGILTINSTVNNEARIFDISMRIFDDQTEGESRTFRFIIAPRNDPPTFEGLDNKTLIIDDVFNYNINIVDEEDNSPYNVDIDFLSCSPIPIGGCDLFGVGDYNAVVDNGVLSISFIPDVNDISMYRINFSVSDTNGELGSAMTSQVVNFSVQAPIWLDDLLVLKHTSNEEEEFYLDLNNWVSPVGGSVSFNNRTSFPFFNLTSEGIINFTSDDVGVGNWSVEVIARNDDSVSLREFNFTILNKNDTVVIQPFSPLSNPPLEIYENLPAIWNLYIQDDDFAISESQKDFYDENLYLEFNLIGPNNTLFIFSEVGLEDPLPTMGYLAEFIPRNGDEGEYHVEINVNDANNFSSDSLIFDFTVINMDYDVPNITSPNEDYEFNLEEGIDYNLIFSVNHTIGDELEYYFYIGEELRNSTLGPGDNSDFIWKFKPKFTDETYGNKTNLTLLVVNPFINNFNISRTWNLTINHTNAPVELIDNIDDRELGYNSKTQINLTYHFLDVDHEDEHYLQNVSFNITSNSSPSSIIVEILDDWIVVFSTLRDEVFNETLKVTAYDLNMSNESIFLTSAESNYFNIKFEVPAIVEVPQPDPVNRGSSTSGSGTPIALKIISPGEVSVYGEEKVIIPIQLINTGERDFNNLNLSATAFKNGDITSRILTSFDENYFKVLKKGQTENLTLEVIFDEEGAGEYEILIVAESKSPKYKDSEKIYLKPINDSQVRELIVFTEQFIAENPQCIEITEVIKEAEQYLQNGDYLNAKIKTEEALRFCSEAITQVAIPKTRMKYFRISLYFVLAVIVAIILGVIYYLIQRRRLQRVLGAPKILNVKALKKERL